MKAYFKFLILSIILILSGFAAFAKIVVQGYTKDESLNVLPYVSFICHNKFIGMSNEKGHYNFQIHDSLKFDTIQCKYLGFKTSYKMVLDFVSNNEQTIVLNRTSKILNDVIVKSKPSYTFGKVKFLGARTKKAKGNYYMTTGCIVGLHIKNEIPKISFLKKAHFYIRSVGFPDTKFRVRVYSANENGMPEKELLDSNYYGQGSAIGEDWVSVDLSSAAIQFPQNGLIIAMEWLPLAEDKVTKIKYGLSEIEFQGQCLGGTYEFDESYSLYYKNQWQKAFIPKDVKLFQILNPMIKAEFDVVK